MVRTASGEVFSLRASRFIHHGGAARRMDVRHHDCRAAQKCFLDDFQLGVQGTHRLDRFQDINQIARRYAKGIQPLNQI